MVAALLIVTALFLHARANHPKMPSPPPLATFPAQLGSWLGSDVPIPADIRDVLGPGDFLLRVYQDTSAVRPYVDLFVAYLPSQRAGDTLHSPKNCLPGSGWSPLESTRISVAWPGHDSFPANRYVIAKGAQRQLVMYWYWSHGRGVASEYWAKFYLVADSIHSGRSDGSLVRVTTPLPDGEPMEAAHHRLLNFVDRLMPLLDQYVPR